MIGPSPNLARSSAENESLTLSFCNTLSFSLTVERNEESKVYDWCDNSDLWGEEFTFRGGPHTREYTAPMPVTAAKGKVFWTRALNNKYVWENAQNEVTATSRLCKNGDDQLKSTL